MRQVESYLQHVAKFAAEQAGKDFNNNFSDDFGCNRGWAFAQWEGMSGPPYFCHVLNTRDDPYDVCLPDSLGIFGSYFGQRMDPYIEKYESLVPEVGFNKDYSVMPVGNELSVIFASPFYIPVKTLGGGIIGSSYFRPSFKVSMQTLWLKNYNKEFLSNVKEIPEECASSYYTYQEVWDCIEFMWLSQYGNQSLVRGGYIDRDLWYFWYPNGHCYALHLPLIEQV